MLGFVCIPMTSCMRLRGDPACQFHGSCTTAAIQSKAPPSGRQVVVILCKPGVSARSANRVVRAC